MGTSIAAPWARGTLPLSTRSSLLALIFLVCTTLALLAGAMPSSHMDQGDALRTKVQSNGSIAGRTDNWLP
jgi:hypothetical protein